MPDEGRGEDELEEGLLSGTRKSSTRFTKRRCKMAGGLIVLVSFLSLLSFGHGSSGLKTTAPTFAIPESEQLKWSAYSPYFALGKYESPPGDCEITQVCSQLISANSG